MKRLMVPLVCVVTLLIPVAVWLISTHGPIPYFTHYVPPGQRFYIVSKLCALLALTLFWFQCMTALARFSPALRGFFSLPRSQHVLLGVTTFVMTLAHVGMFITASTLRTGRLALPLLVPKFDQGFYTAFVSVGAIAVWLLLMVVIAGAMRVRGHTWARWIHRISFMVFGLGYRPSKWYLDTLQTSKCLTPAERPTLPASSHSDGSSMGRIRPGMPSSRDHKSCSQGDIKTNVGSSWMSPLHESNTSVFAAGRPMTSAIRALQRASYSAASEA